MSSFTNGGHDNHLGVPGLIPDHDDEQNFFLLSSSPGFSARDEVYRKNNRRLTEQGKELGNYIRDLYDLGYKLYSKDTFRDLEAALAADPKPATFMLRSMNGTLQRKHIPKEGIDPSCPMLGDLRASIRFTIYQALVYEAEDEALGLDPEDLDEPWLREVELNREKMALACRAVSLSLVDRRLPDTPYDELRLAWDEALYNWERNPTREKLFSALASIHCPANANKLVCFGLGSLEGSQNYNILYERSKKDNLPLRSAMTQHLAALDMATALGDKIGTEPLRILAQDPAYSVTAQRLLAEEGIEVVAGRGCLGFTYVDENAIVFSCHPDIPVKQIVADIATPAGMIWNRVRPKSQEKTDWTITEAWGQEIVCGPWSTDEDSLRTRELILEYDQVDFPKDTDRFGELVIYMRNDSNDTTAT